MTKQELMERIVECLQWYDNYYAGEDEHEAVTATTQNESWVVRIECQDSKIFRLIAVEDA